MTASAPRVPVRRALVLTGSIGMGHDAVTAAVTDALGAAGVSTTVLDSMALLGGRGARLGEWAFRQALARPGLYDALHFAHLRPGSAVAERMDAAATRRLVPALRTHLQTAPADLVIATFATGASAIGQLVAAGAPGSASPRTAVLCPDVTPHRLWVHAGVEVFLVTSETAAAGVRRYLPRARIEVVPPPLRPEFERVPDRAEARRVLGVAPAARCVLVMGGGWGLGPLVAISSALAGAGVHVLAVSGANRRLATELETLAARQPLVHALGFSTRMPQLMAASDLVLTTPGAASCSEARALGRPLLLLDVVPGHGRDNIQHQLSLGRAEVADPRPDRLTASVLAALDRWGPVPEPDPAGQARRPWRADFLAALRRAGVGLDQQPVEVTAAVRGGVIAGPQPRRAPVGPAAR